MNALYTASATSTGGRDGGVRTADGVLDLKLAIPTGLGGPGGDKTNPEELFAAGYAACFHEALKKKAAERNVAIRDSRVTVDVGIGKDGNGFGLEVAINVALPGVDEATAQSLIHTAHEFCPYSKATRNTIPVRLALIGSDEKAHAVV